MAQGHWLLRFSLLHFVPLHATIEVPSCAEFASLQTRFHYQRMLVSVRHFARACIPERLK